VSGRRGVLLGAATLREGNGGIARVSRLSLEALRGLGETVAAGSLLDTDDTARPIGARGFAGSKMRFAAWCLPAMRGCRAALFDHIGPARVYKPPFTGSCDLAVWMHGSEIWEGLTRHGDARLSMARLLLVNSHATLRRHEALHGPRPNARVCWLATEQDEPAKLTAHMEGPPTALIVGRMDLREWGKGHEELIQVWPQVRMEVPDARLVIAGTGSGLDKVRALVRNSAAASHIEVMGYVPEERLSELYASAHILAMPSRQEGFGIVYIEAMRHGLACLASRQDSGQEITLHEETGLNVDLSQPNALREALVALLSNRDRARAYGAAGRARWSAHFRRSAFAERFSQIWLEAFGTPEAKHPFSCVDRYGW
jgi:phosphatidylinositol alpha-1,6-mannosyltransferase